MTKRCNCEVSVYPTYSSDTRTDGDCPIHADKDAHIDSQAHSQGNYRVSQVVKDITERLLRAELAQAINCLGPQKAAQVVVQVFRQKGLPKELRRHV